MRWLPVVGLAAFAVLAYFAVHTFPGGSRFRPEARGFGFVDNFWCDLFDARAPDGATNGGRKFAIEATVVLALSLIPFWISISAISPNEGRPRLIQIGGVLGMTALALVPTRLHDAAIFVAGPCALVAYGLTVQALVQSGRRMFALISVVPALLSALTFVLWSFSFGIHAIPALQKVAALLSLGAIMALHFSIAAAADRQNSI